MATISLQVLRRQIAHAIPGGSVSVHTGDVGATSGGDSLRVLHAADLVNTALDEHAYDNWWIHILATYTGQQRQVEPGGYAPHLGMLTVGQPFAGTFGSTAFELLWPLPAHSNTDGSTPVTGLYQCMLDALRNLWREDRISVTTVAGQSTYDLSAYAAWLDDQDRILDLLDPPLSSAYPRQSRMDIRRPTLRVAGGAVSLELATPYRANGATAELVVRRPLFSQVNGAESSAGPTADTDTFVGDLDDITTMALWFIYRYLAGAWFLTPEQRQRYAALVPHQEEQAKALDGYERHERAGEPATREEKAA